VFVLFLEVNMKKFLVMALLLGIISGMAFAADSYTVQSVTGKVEREVAPGKWETVKAGATLTEATVIKTGLNAGLALKSGDKTFNVPAMKRGAVETLIGSTVASGIRIGGQVYESDTSSSVRGTSNISTASARASDAAGDYIWEE
jgi:hypothetical protein